jgi:uncharacterized protein (DUF4415 family)
MKCYTAAELEAGRSESLTDLSRVDALTDEELERLISEDEGERDLQPDWTQARLVIPSARQSVHLRLDRDIVDFFKAQGKGHISRMQAVLRAYVEAHKRKAK